MQITNQMVDKVAELAKLVLTAQEEQWFQKELQSIVDYMELLNEFPGDLGELPAEVQKTQLREDDLKTSEVFDSIILQAPQVTNGMFVVPRVLDRD